MKLGKTRVKICLGKLTWMWQLPQNVHPASTSVANLHAPCTHHALDRHMPPLSDCIFVRLTDECVCSSAVYLFVFFCISLILDHYVCLAHIPLNYKLECKNPWRAGSFQMAFFRHCRPFFRFLQIFCDFETRNQGKPNQKEKKSRTRTKKYMRKLEEKEKRKEKNSWENHLELV